MSFISDILSIENFYYNELYCLEGDHFSVISIHAYLPIFARKHISSIKSNIIKPRKTAVTNMW
jgi:hypothetical protein